MLVETLAEANSFNLRRRFSELNDSGRSDVSTRARHWPERSDNMNEPDPTTIAHAVRGDQQAFADLIHLYQEPVCRFLAHLLGDRHAAEDATQETFIRVHGKLHTFEARSKFSSWVFQIARNTGLDIIRKQQRRPALSNRPTEDVPYPGSPSTATEIDAALAALPVPQREAILIIEVLGYTYREAAQITGVAEGTFKSRVHHGRVALAEWFDPKEQANEM